jgi:DNA-binding response OmpR family regulator
MRILLVEDELEMARLIASNLGDAGYIVDRVGSLSEGGAALSVARYSVILLDRRLPDGDGVSLMSRIRGRMPGVPVLILTALDDVANRVGGLDAGADDYLTKPFAIEELLARIRAALRRPGGENQPAIQCGRLRFDPSSRRVDVDDKPVVLKRRELSLIEALIRRTGRVVARETLMDEVYGFDDDIQSNTLDAHISRLRARLAQLQAGVLIHPVRGVGYMLDAA